MPTYAWRGRDASGAAVDGTVDGASPDMVAAVLAGRGITPLKIEAATTVTSSKTETAWFGRRQPITGSELQLFSRQLQALLRAGLPIMRALGAMQESATRPAVARLLGDLCASLDQGRELSAAMARHPEDFPALYVALVRVGEQTGRLDDILRRLAAWLDFEMKTRERIRTALRYPSFVMIAMGIALLVVNVFVIPRFASVYKSMKTELPLMTQILIGVSNFIMQYWWLVLAAGVGAVWLTRRWLAGAPGRLAFDRLVLSTPVIGRLLHNAALGRFSRSLALTLKSGLPASQAITLVSQAVGNAFITQRLERVRSGVERGESLLRSCAQTGVFTPIVLQMIAVGEESGSLDEMLDHAADFYEQDVDYDLQRLSAAIEPILILVLGSIVLILALGVFLPIWDLGKAAMNRG